MSLLMQALKKAEHAKKNGLPSDDALAQAESPKILDEALALTPKESDAAIVNSAAVEKKTPLPTLLPESTEIPELTLVFEPAGPSDQKNPVEQKLDADALLVPSEVKQAPTAFATLMPDNKATSSAPTTVKTPEPSPIPPRPTTPKISLEQQQAAEQEAKKIVASQQKAQSVFSSKQAPRKRPVFMIASLSVAVAALLGLSGYFYWQIAGQSPPILTTATPNPQPLPAAPIETPPVPSAPSVTASASTSPPGGAAPENVPSPAKNTLAAVLVEVASAPETHAKKGVVVADAIDPQNKLLPAKKTPLPSSGPAQNESIKVLHNSSGNQINPVLQSAYQFFQSGDTTAAKQQYDKVLQQDANNRDALLGLAAIALGQKQASEAATYYVRLLELDPGDPDAIGGLTSLQQGNSEQIESRLKKILAQNPNASAVLFVLGNVYARQARWSDAQQTYFRAFGSAPDNADYAFNLAVSLDRLNQSKLALDYYQRALSLDKKNAGNFARNSVQARVTELQSSINN